MRHDDTYEHRDRFTAESGRYYLTGWDALTRLPIMQRRLDLRAGHSTAGYVSGYPGSPLGGFDSLLRRERELLRREGIHFEPGVNEDLAATAVGGTQYVNTTPEFSSVSEGIFGLWYGKGPGVERSTDAIRTASYLGTHPLGGVIAIAGDDHDARSTVTAQQSDTLFIHMHMPILSPATVQEFLDFGIAGWGLSRFASTWVGLPCINDVVDSAMVVDVNLDRLRFSRPSNMRAVPPAGTSRAGGAGVFGAADIEREIIELRYPAAQAYVRENRLDRVLIRSADPTSRRLGIITAGKSYLDTLSALSELGLDDERKAEHLGLGLLKLALTWPLDPEVLLDFVSGFDEILVVEPKYPIIEDQVNRLVRSLGAAQRPVVVGKSDDSGRPLIRQYGALDSQQVARAIAARLGAVNGDRGIVVPRPRSAAQLSLRGDQPRRTLPLVRAAGFCSGCPHSTSTRVPDGSVAISGTGCHAMAMTISVPGRHTAKTYTQMGGEGGTWLGLGPFAEKSHVFQNMGDGTYHHSGHLVIRAAVAANLNITFKILYNGYIAMTGGQSTPSEQTPVEIANRVASEGVTAIAIVTEDLGRYTRRTRRGLPTGTTVHHRSELNAVQLRLASKQGVTVLIFDQPCAAELRRRRKRGEQDNPGERVYINSRVCEGCGDCNTQSNCISVEPLETDLGRKRKINQSSCNFDSSCVSGYCPSFVTVRGGQPRRVILDTDRQRQSAIERLGAPDRVAVGNQPYSILVGGIGGGGVLTIGAILGMAAHLDGMGVTVLNESGLAQKNGAVESHVRITKTSQVVASPRIGVADCDVVIGADPLVVAGRGPLSTMGSARTWAVLDNHVSPTVGFAGDSELDFSAGQLIDTVRGATANRTAIVDATRVALAIMGDAIYANLILLGFAAQLGRLPVSLESLHRAIEINGVAVDSNQCAFDWGRIYADDPDSVRKLIQNDEPAQSRELSDVIDRRALELSKYQSASYSQRYRTIIECVREREVSLGLGENLTRAAAESLFKLMAYKDEYEVARLYVEPEFRQRLAQEFQGKIKVSVNLAPQILNRRDKSTGRARKFKLPLPVIMPAFRLLHAIRRLRGSPFDLFGLTKHRRAERARIASFERLLLSTIIPQLTTANYKIAVELAALPSTIRGFDMIKDAAAARAADRESELLSEFLDGAASAGLAR